MPLIIENKSISLKYFLYEIVHHCNLNCKGCDHCSPIADEENIDIKTIETDFKNIKKNFKKILTIGLMGGEPLLHPNLLLILKLARKQFNKSNILLFTNAILLPEKDENFWLTLKKNKIILILTKYDLNINFKRLEEKAKENKVFLFYENEDKIKKYFNKIALVEEGNYDAEKAFSKCYHAKHCTTLENSCLYKCPIIPASRHINTYFNKNLKITERDYIDIRKKINKDEIIKFFSSPSPFCRYCNIEERNKKHKWDISQKKENEWLYEKDVLD